MTVNGMRMLFLLSLALGFVFGKRSVPQAERPAAKKPRS
jgi:hypothetical protein